MKDNFPMRLIVVPKIVDTTQTIFVHLGEGLHLNGSDAHGPLYFLGAARLVQECEDV